MGIFRWNVILEFVTLSFWIIELIRLVWCIKNINYNDFRCYFTLNTHLLTILRHLTDPKTSFFSALLPSCLLNYQTQDCWVSSHYITETPSNFNLFPSWQHKITQKFGDILEKSANCHSSQIHLLWHLKSQFISHLTNKPSKNSFWCLIFPIHTSVPYILFDSEFQA